MMAPTEILARQHHATLAPLAAAAGIKLALLTGRDKGKARREKVESIAAGMTPLVVGTHALFQSDVAFRDLALAVIDEQHRFGVHQRLDLTGKGTAVDVLVMTATPIPRTLMLTAYGDMLSSRLTEKPPGRKPVDTRALPIERLEEVIAAVGRALARGIKVFWVCPLVGESEAIDLAAAEARHVELAARFKDKVALVHGQMKGPKKDEAMRSFIEGDVDLLVATTVIEVGVDVPAARIMVIEHAGSGAARRAARACCSTRRRWAMRRARGSVSCARPTTAFVSPRRTCVFAARASCWAPGKAGCRISAWPNCRCTKSCSLRRAMMPG
jgi:ATP-dependent DNA helicase RecG